MLIRSSNTVGSKFKLDGSWVAKTYDTSENARTCHIWTIPFALLQRELALMPQTALLNSINSILSSNFHKHKKLLIFGSPENHGNSRSKSETTICAKVVQLSACFKVHPYIYPIIIKCHVKSVSNSAEVISTNQPTNQPSQSINISLKFFNVFRHNVCRDIVYVQREQQRTNSLTRKCVNLLKSRRCWKQTYGHSSFKMVSSPPPFGKQDIYWIGFISGFGFAKLARRVPAVIGVSGPSRV